MISLDKKYRTEDGHEARIYAVDGYGSHSVHGAVKTASGWEGRVWTAGGTTALRRGTGGDLVEIRPRIKREVWMNVYSNGSVVAAFSTKAEANRFSDIRIACVKITIDCQEGDGL